MESDKIIPILDLKAQYASIRSELHEAAGRVLDSGIYILGPEVKALEEEFAKAHRVPHCAAVSSGTSALRLAMEAVGVGPGDEVAVPAFTFVATATAVAALGAAPLLIDVDPDSLTLDAADLSRRAGPKVKAVIPVHLYGHPADMDPINAAAAERGLQVIEDCAQAHLAMYKGRLVGGLGRFGAFSFYPSKNLGALGDAGALTTKDKDMLDLVLMLRNAGRPPGGQYEHRRIGHNCRLDEIQAAFLRVKLRRLHAWTDARRRVAALYREMLADLPLTLPPAEGEGGRSVYHLFTVRTEKRDALAEHLGKAGVRSGVYYPSPIHLTPAFKHLGLKEGALPVSERASREVLSLPMFPELTGDEIQKVGDAVRSFYKGTGG